MPGPVAIESTIPVLAVADVAASVAFGHVLWSGTGPRDDVPFGQQPTRP